MPARVGDHRDPLGGNAGMLTRANSGKRNQVRPRSHVRAGPPTCYLRPMHVRIFPPGAGNDGPRPPRIHRASPDPGGLRPPPGRDFACGLRRQPNMRAAIVAAFTFSLAPALAGTSPAAAQEIDTLALRAHTRFLASDLLEGRGAGTRGEHIAAEYIASQLTRLGLRPIGRDYLQPVPLSRLRIGAGTRALVRSGTDSAVFRHGADFVLGAGSRSAFRNFAGPVVLVGPSDDGSGSPPPEVLRGAVVLTLAPLGADADRLIPAWKAAGVAGIILPVGEAEQFALLVRSRGPDRYFLDAAVDDAVWQPEVPSIMVGPRLLDGLLRGVRLPPAVAGDGPFDPVPLPRRMEVSVDASAEAVRAANVGGIIPGTDPARAHEWVVYTAHYDHLGISVPDAAGDSIYNGFSDNAAGVAMLLAVARALVAEPPPRSVLFLFLTAEERGLLGSTYYATSPIAPLETIRALINLDAGAPPAPPRNWRIAGDSTKIGPLIRDVAAARGWDVLFSPATPNSDYWPFARRGVPAVFLVPGDEWEGTSAERRTELRKRWDHYHAASDHWSEDFPFSGLARYATFALELGRAAANLP